MNAIATQFSNGQFELAVTPHPVDGLRVQAPGLAKALSVDGAYNLLRSIPEPEKGSSLVSTPGGDQQVGYVTEAGFYRALGMRQTGRIQDDMTRARVESFQNWVYREVLPSLRTTGGYEVKARSVEDVMAEGLVAAQKMLAEKDERLAIAAPKARAWDVMVSAHGGYGSLKWPHLEGF